MNSHYITLVEKTSNGRQKIYIDGEYAFTLYRSEMPFWCTEEAEIDESRLEYVYKEILIPRGKKRALYLLKNRDYSWQGLKDKLDKDGYPEEVVETVMNYINSFHYIDDMRYAGHIIREKQTSKSRREIIQNLKQKGISDDTIESALDEFYQSESYESPEIDAIKKIIRKKNITVSELTYEEKQKLCASLYRKGFSMENICKVTGSSEY